MQQAQSRSSARISAAVTAAAAASMQAAAIAGYGGNARRGGQEGVERHQMQESQASDQKPDIRYLEALNQQALMQQLAEFSGAVSDHSTNSEMAKSYQGDKGPQGRQVRSDNRLPDASIHREEEWGRIGAATTPTASSHRRKPALVRHVDNDDGTSNSTDHDGNNSSLMSDAGVDLGDDENLSDEEAEDDDKDEPRVFFQNGTSMPTSHHAPTRSSQTHSMSTRSSQEFSSVGRSSAHTGALPANQALLPTRITPMGAANLADTSSTPGRNSHQISLANFTAEELINHLMSRQDVHRCDFCRLIFQDAAMYHIHRNMHDKNDLRCCNLCGKMMQDKYDFTAHFLNEHQA